MSIPIQKVKMILPLRKEILPFQELWNRTGWKHFEVSLETRNRANTGILCYFNFEFTSAPTKREKRIFKSMKTFFLGLFLIKLSKCEFSETSNSNNFLALVKIYFMWKLLIKLTTLERMKRSLGNDFRAHTCSMKKLKLRREWFEYSSMLRINNTRTALKLLTKISAFRHESLLTQLYCDAWREWIE